jgi:hypothetical protein
MNPQFKFEKAATSVDGSEVALLEKHGRVLLWNPGVNLLFIRKMPYPPFARPSARIDRSESKHIFVKFVSVDSVTLSYSPAENFLAAFGDRWIAVWKVPSGELVSSRDVPEGVVGYYLEMTSSLLFART